MITNYWVLSWIPYAEKENGLQIPKRIMYSNSLLEILFLIGSSRL